MNITVRVLTMGGVVLGMLLASYMLVFAPVAKQIKTTREEVEHREKLLETLRQEVARNADLEQANEEIQQSVQLIEARLPSDREMAEVIRQVSDTAVQAGLNSPSIKTNKPLQAALYKEQPLEVEVMGDFRGILTFLISLEKLPRIMRIPDMKIVAQSKDEEQLKVEFTLSVYYQERKAATTASAGGAQ